MISVGTRITLRQNDGSHKDYLLLRVSPIETMRKIWIFPVAYSSAEIGLITSGCDYVIPSIFEYEFTYAPLGDKGVPSIAKNPTNERYPQLGNIENVELSFINDGTLLNHEKDFFRQTADRFASGELSSP